MSHAPVLLKEAIESLEVTPNEWYIDATLGGGGHTSEILKRGGNVLSIDVDEEAIGRVTGDLRIGENLKIGKGNFRDIDSIAKENGIEAVSGILFDLGVSSFQLDTPGRGFSFQREGPLDMRMDLGLGVKAEDLINGLTQKELYELFSRLGEERYALAISKSITESRRVRPIRTTTDLAEIAERVIRGNSDVHKATRIFQALRIAVNDELGAISEALPKALELLKPKGRLVVISFHSLEDRIVKNTFKEFGALGKATIITKKPIVPSKEEIAENRRSRSAKLRVIEKIELA